MDACLLYIGTEDGLLVVAWAVSYTRVTPPCISVRRDGGA